MLSYKEYLLEGIIKIDPIVLRFINDSYYSLLANILGFMLEDRHKEIIKKLQNKELDKFISENKILKSKTGYRNIPYTGYNVSGNFSFFLEIDENSDVGAEYHRKNHHTGTDRKIISYLDKKFFDDFSDWLKSPNESKLKSIIEEKVNQVEHELGHLVEDFILDKRVEQNNQIKINKFKKDYNTNHKSYLTSEIEFEPMIISMVRKFISKIKQQNIPISVEEYKTKIDQYLNDDTEDFFFYHKRLSPVKYKTLIKKIYVELIDNIEKLKSEGILK